MVETEKPVEMVGPTTVHKPVPMVKKKAKKPVKKAKKRGR
jgi:hypothetical protein